MGRRIIALSQAGDATTVAAAVEVPGSELIGRDAGEVAGIDAIGVAITGHFAAATRAAGSGAVAVDFTSPEAAIEHARTAAETGTPIVIGTTGLTAAQRGEIEELSTKVAILQAANMSLGVNVLLGLVRQAAARLSGFDIEIVELHHNKKKDAPSGTALALAEAAAQAARLKAPSAFTLARQGMTGERKAGEIGVVALRGGDNVGEHTVMLIGTGERVELTHRAASRDCLAAGAVRAGAWLAGKPAGLYSMEDLLGL